MIGEKTCWAVIVAAGKGVRAGLSYNKAFCEINGRSVLFRSVDALEKCGVIDGIVIVISKSDEQMFNELCRRENISACVKGVAFGGDTRQKSVYNGLKALPDNCDIVAIHDAARAFVPQSVVKATIESAYAFSSGIAATRITDTVKVVDECDNAVNTLDRSSLRAVQTPQTFCAKKIIYAHERAAADGYEATDDAALYERYVGKSRLVVCDEGARNRKLTTREDFNMIEGEQTRGMRVGYGYDAHRLVEGRKLVLCGVEIPFDKGLLGHSDADCAVHALIDALLSAAGQGDIGRMFPDTDMKYKDIYSIKLLKSVMNRLDTLGVSVINVDVTIIAQKPRLADYMEEMRTTLALAMKADVSRVNVKATTTERMGYEGRGEGISSCAVALINYR